MKIYNLFPTYAGPVARWRSHALRAKTLGFDRILLNPFQAAGATGSLYAIRDPFRLHERLDPDGSGSLEPVFAFVRDCRAQGIAVMTDLVLTRVALEATEVAEHPEWFRRGEDGRPAPPVDLDGERVAKIWTDQVEIAREGDDVPAGLLERWIRLVDHLLDAGFSGFNFERPDRFPPAAFAKLLAHIRGRAPKAVLLAETLGMEPAAIAPAAAAGLDRIQNASKFWDGRDPWCVEQHARARPLCASLSFPETHATNRLMADVNGDVRLVKQRLTLASFFSASLLVPIGFEFGHRKKLDAMTTRPEDWEGVHVDLSSFVRRVNNIKSNYGVLSCEGRIDLLSRPGDPVLQLLKRDETSGETALLLMNTDPWTYHPVVIENLKRTMGTDSIVIDISPEYPVDGLQNHYQYYLKPTQAKMLYAPGRLEPDVEDGGGV